MSLLENSSAFIHYVDELVHNLKPIKWSEVITDPQRTAILSVDLIVGFCYEGKLASPRIAAIVPNAVRLFEQAYARGVRQFVLVQEWHHENAEEFKAFAPHGIRHTREAETVPELAALPFADSFVILRKNSVNPAFDTGLDDWLNAHPIHTAIVVGDCTDICAYLLALHLRTRANQRNEPLRVIVPANCVQTYDLPLPVAQPIGAMPHDGDFLHALFLYHMALHKLEVVSAIEA